MHFRASIVMAVYKTEHFLQEAIESVLAQDIGFQENIQLILVNVGSMDGSGEICNSYAAKYPENIIVLHKKNGSFASARNAGLALATGDYVNFMDSADKIAENFFSAAAGFLALHCDEIDMVTMPIKGFGGTAGPAWQNNQFRRGTRVIHLRMEPAFCFAKAASSLFKRSAVEQLRFDDRLVCSEDFKFIYELLSEKRKVGVVHDTVYHHRSNNLLGAPSRGCTQKRVWFFEHFEYCIDWIFDFYNKKSGGIPLFVRHAVMTELSWRFKPAKDWLTLSEEDATKYIALLEKTLKKIDDDIILGQPNMAFEHKLQALKLKHGEAPELEYTENDAALFYGENPIKLFSKFCASIFFITLDEKTVEIEGCLCLPAQLKDKEMRFFLSNENQEFPCQMKYRVPDKDFYGEPLLERIYFSGTVNLVRGEHHAIRIGYYYDGNRILSSNIAYGKYTPINPKKRSSDYYNFGWTLKKGDQAVLIHPQEKRKSTRELRWFLHYCKRKKYETALLRILSFLFASCLKKAGKELWLFSDRANKADDNGEVLFEYVQKQKPKNIISYFLIKKTSPDFKRLKKIGKVAAFGSFKHKLLYLLASKLMSSSSIVNVFHAFGIQAKADPFRDIISQKKVAFLQHGITINDVSALLNRYGARIFSLFVTSAKPEYESILNYDYYYSEKQVKLLGFPRYDMLYHDEKKMITLMPTWRRKLSQLTKEYTGDELLEQFRMSDYFKFYNGLFRDNRLLEAADKAGYTLKFMPHPEMTIFLSAFDLPQQVKIAESGERYRDVFAQSNLIVTDYSSASMDFAYMRKPVLYTQFDHEEFWVEQQYDHGYFDYERDGFGEVELTLEASVNRMIEYINSDCALKDEYRERIDRFFTFHDQNNCKRVLDAILEM